MSLATEWNNDIKYSCKHVNIKKIINFLRSFRGNTRFIQKVTFEPLMDFKQNHHQSWKYYMQKLLPSKVFFTKVIKTHNYFFVAVLLDFFIRQTLAVDFWVLHKNMNGAFPLKFALFNKGSNILGVSKNQFKSF